MFEIKLKNNVKFLCEKDSTIFSAAKRNGIILEHSCLTARCRSCKIKVVKGETTNIQEELVLTETEKKEGYILSCNSVPLTDLIIDEGDVYELPPVKTLPIKVDSLEKLSVDIIKVILRFPPNSNFEFIPGQYINILKGNIKRSYSIANNFREDSKLELYIKNYEGGVMSDYWFNQARVHDLLRMEGPKGTFFFRNSSKTNLIFLATGTGIAPVKAIIEQIEKKSNDFKDKKILIIWGNRYKYEFIWNPKVSLTNLELISVLSKIDNSWNAEIGYVQNILLKTKVNLKDSDVYACGSYNMIDSAKKILIKNGLSEANFYSDAFVSSN